MDLLKKIRSTSHLTNKPKKAAALRSLENLIASFTGAPATAVAAVRFDLDVLHAFFNDPKPLKKAADCDLAWVNQATHKASKSRGSRGVMDHMIVLDGVLVATDGARLHWVENSGFPDGYITSGGHPKEVDGCYPNYLNVIPRSFGRQEPISVDSITNVRPHDVGKACTVLVGGCEFSFNMTSLMEALNGMKGAHIKVNGTGQPVKITDGRRNAVLMPLRR